MAKKTGKASNGGHQHQYGIRFDPELRDKVDVYREKMRASTGIKITYAVAIRALIERGLEAQASS